jgi:hypothetical protein
VRNATTQEDASDAGKKEAKAQQEAINSISPDKILTHMLQKPGDSYTVPYKKRNVTISYIGPGTYRIQCGKKYKEVSI